MVKVMEVSVEKTNLHTVENGNKSSPIKTPFKEPSEISTDTVAITDTSVSDSNLSPPSTQSIGDGKSSTPNSFGGESSLTDVSPEVSSLGDVYTPPGNRGTKKTEMLDASTQSEKIITVNKSSQTEALFENNFLNKFNLDLLLANMKSLISDISARNGNYTQNFLKHKFISSFVSSYQKSDSDYPEENKSSRRVVSSDDPARRTTPFFLSRSAKSSSLPRPSRPRLKSLNFPV